MKRPLLALFLLVASTAAVAQQDTTQLTIAVDPRGDTEQGVVAHVTFRLPPNLDAPPETTLLLQGSFLEGGIVLKNFRYEIPPDRRDIVKTTQTFPVGELEVDAKLIMPLDEGAPVILSKTSAKFPIVKTNRIFVAGADDGAEAILAEGIVPESVGAVKIRAPRRDVAPNLFIINVDVQEPVKRVEFWVEGKKVLARNAPPYRAELDLGKLPKRVEVRAVGYDEAGRYVDADAFIVNERETPLEVKITRTITPDGLAHFKLSIQNPKNTELKTIALFAGQKKIQEWTRPPYAIDLPSARLQGVDFVRASVIDDTGYEASDIFFLSGERYMEELEVNLVELPVTITDKAGVPITTLEQKNFTVFENAKPQKIATFNFASNLPLSLGVLVDHSGSMEKRMKETKDAAVEFFKSIIKPNDKAFIAGFAMDPTRNAPFVTSVSALEQQVAMVPDAGGGTSLYDAIVTGLYRFRTLQGRKALVVLSDGEDTTSRLAYDDMLTYVRAARVPLYFIGIGLGFSDMSGTSKMKALAAET
ncbi:MAG TPA: VWA domain-containing protein, partial [Thermoanaerobaculia bacterium]|nr:VWA domain-containing protein [Thermoanaerobaculia bacterium]